MMFHAGIGVGRLGVIQVAAVHRACCGARMPIRRDILGTRTSRRGIASISRPSSHYDALNLETSASPSQIKTSYIAIARKNHPDVTNDPAAANTYMRAAEAYEVLMDSVSKMQYDANLRQHHKQAPSGNRRKSEARAQESVAETELRATVENGGIDEAVSKWAAWGSSLELLLFLIERFHTQKAVPSDFKKLLNHLHAADEKGSSKDSGAGLPVSTEKTVQLFVERKTRAYNALIKLTDLHGTREDLFEVIDEMDKHRVQIDMDTYYMLEEAFQWKS